MPTLHIHSPATDTPYARGHRHGSAAAPLVARTLAFYAAYFARKAELDWAAATAVAARFLPLLERACPHLVEEMRGVADGAGVGLADIMALNARTEISMGLGVNATDGCSALYVGVGAGEEEIGDAILAQNWDWERPQRENLVALHIAAQEENGGGRPAIAMVTEAGVIGKIGLNGAGVGVCLNAVRASGVAFDRLPVHIALRLALECRSRAEVERRLTDLGVAASCHILVADARSGAVGLECSHADVRAVPMRGGVLAHTNHWLVPHAGPDGAPIVEVVSLPDSGPRLRRLDDLLADLQKESGGGGDMVAAVSKVLEDDQNFPASINKAPSPANPAETLFSIVMDLARRTAEVRLGRPTEAVDRFTFDLA